MIRFTDWLLVLALVGCAPREAPVQRPPPAVADENAEPTPPGNPAAHDDLGVVTLVETGLSPRQKLRYSMRPTTDTMTCLVERLGGPLEPKRKMWRLRREFEPSADTRHLSFQVTADRMATCPWVPDSELNAPGRAAPPSAIAEVEARVHYELDPLGHHLVGRLDPSTPQLSRELGLVLEAWLLPLPPTPVGSGARWEIQQVPKGTDGSNPVQAVLLTLQTQRAVVALLGRDDAHLALGDERVPASVSYAALYDIDLENPTFHFQLGASWSSTEPNLAHRVRVRCAPDTSPRALGGAPRPISHRPIAVWAESDQPRDVRLAFELVRYLEDRRLFTTLATARKRLGLGESATDPVLTVGGEPIGPIGDHLTSEAFYREAQHELALRAVERGWSLTESHEKRARSDLLVARGRAQAAFARWDQALGAFRAAFETDPSFEVAQREYAWWLAASPDPNQRDAARALALARELWRRAPQSAKELDLLAVAHAAAGRFDEATRLERQALGVTERDPTCGGRALRLELFEAKRSWVERHPR